MKLNRAEVRIYSILLDSRRRHTLTQLAKIANMKKSNTSRYVKKLKKFGLLNLSKVGRKLEIYASHTHFLNFSKVKEQLSHLKIEDLLIGKMPHFLAYLHWYVRKQLNQRKSVVFNISDIHLPAITTRRLLNKLSSIGIVYRPSNGCYSTRKEAREAMRFCNDILTEMYFAESEHELKGILRMLISFENPEKAECVFITETKITSKNYWPTAYTPLHEFGVQLISDGKYYYTNIKPKLVDIIIHILALDRSSDLVTPISAADARTIMYVAVLLLKNKFEYKKLLKKENKFGISDAFLMALIEFVTSKGTKTYERFPTWSEVEGVLNG